MKMIIICTVYIIMYCVIWQIRILKYTAALRGLVGVCLPIRAVDTNVRPFR
jgi:hypothetical protein